MSDVTLEDIASLAKRRGFIYQGSEIYGGLAGTWDYGPLGVALKRNITNLWWKMFVDSRDDMYGVDAAILMNQKVWQASGHTATFTDPVVICLSCNNRFRVDQIVNEDEYKQFVERVLIDFLNKQGSLFKNEQKALEELKKKNLPLSKQVDKDIQEWQKLKKSGVSSDVYSAWLEKAQERIEEDVNHLKHEVQQYDYLAAFSSILNSLLQKIIETKQYLGEFAQLYLRNHTSCPVCKERKWNVPRRFNMMFMTHVGPMQDESSVSYLRPETAQGMFVNFKNVVDSFYPDMPFGLAQVGKAFRNEISPRDFTFRAREFEQMEIEYFIRPEDWETKFEEWQNAFYKWFKAIGLPKEMIHELDVPAEDRAHYSKKTIDFEFDFPHGKKELYGLAYRTDFDLKNHQEHSGKSMEYRPKDGGTPFTPHVIEPTFGVDRTVLAVLCAAYTVDEIKGEKRVYLKLPHELAPVKAAVSPLLKNKPELVAKAHEVYDMLKNPAANSGAQYLQGAVMWDDNGNIGKRYRRQDEIGTPECITIDFQTLEDNTVTVRDRDTAQQTRVKIEDLAKKSSFVKWQ